MDLGAGRPGGIHGTGDPVEGGAVDERPLLRARVGRIADDEVLAAAVNRSTTSSAMLWCTNTLEPAVQFCPIVRNAASIMSPISSSP